MDNYTIGIKELDDAIGGIRKGSNIILLGPPMSGKEAILDHIVHQRTTNESAVIIVTTRESSTHVLERLKENKLNLSLSKIGIVDCVSKMLGDAAVETGDIKTVNSPADLTSMGVKISQFFEDFLAKNIRKIQLHINSLSTILMFSNIQTIFRFLYVLTGRIKAAGALGIYVVDSEMHDEQAIATLKQLCDGMIEVKSENYRNFIRIVGLIPKSTPWFEYVVEGTNVKIVSEKAC